MSSTTPILNAQEHLNTGANISTTRLQNLLMGVILALSLQVSAFGANHYIRAGATGAKDGSSWTNAWPTFASVNWTRGDTYYVAGGTYTEDVKVTKSLSGSLWITIKKANAADNSTVAGWSSVYETTQAVINGRLFLFDGFVKFDGITGHDETGHGFKVVTPTTTAYVVNLGANSGPFKLYHTEVRGAGFRAGALPQDGIYNNNAVTHQKGLHIAHCYIHEVTRNGITVGGLVGTSYSDYGLLFENNFLSETGGCTDAAVHGQGMQISFGTPDAFTVIRHNKFRNATGTGMIVWLGGAGSHHRDARVHNNTFWMTDLSTYINCSPGIIYAHAAASSQARFEIYNNTVYGVGSVEYPVHAHPQFIIDTAGATGNTLKNNIFESNHFTTTHRGFASQSNNGYYNNTGSGVPSGTANQISGTSTAFLNAAAADFRLIAGGYPIGRALDGGDLGAIPFTTGASALASPSNARVVITESP